MWNAANVLPFKPDVYLRDYSCNGKTAIKYCRWDGRLWYGAADTKEYARTVSARSLNQDLPWCETTNETTDLRAA